jgi:putative membrane protein
MTRQQLASILATATLALWPAVSIAQTPPPSTSPPSSTPPATPTTQPRPGTTTPPPAERAGERMGQKGSNPDQAFAMAAATGGLAEVELGKLGVDKASNADVKKFAQKMVDDHGKANDELKGILQQKGITVPSELKGKEKSTHERLSKLSGAEFDKAYMSDMVRDHEKDVKEFERESTNGKDPELKAFASKTLPTLQEHLKMARETQSKLGAGTN